MSLARRTVLGAALSACAAPALAQVVTDSAPAATDPAAWTAYETRLRARLDDIGGGRADPATGRAMLDLTNRIRRDAGSPPVIWHDELAASALAHAGDLAQRSYVEHLSPEGFDPSHRLWLLGRTTIGSPSENIAYHRGPPTSAGQMLQRLKGSTGHWKNLLRPTHTHAGYAFVTRGERYWLVGLYARPLAALSEPLPFRAQGPAIRRALTSLSSEHRPRLAIPQGSRLGKVAGAPPVMQITALRPADDGRYDIVGGPIFIAAEAG
ncbi:CAP domain-containing protein [Phenylobacterium sp.]|uniref:CAP domain-containing protein n=1 Tax=Phenylobacterium sp. TaxID=1871053 RepID=UPI0011FBEDBF|nr:CAP domain-containing protein [Phenylobacterium sp.]TAL34186.1 MAG: CAP domain-containing protein [Phenylobacterium sp.]